MTPKKLKEIKRGSVNSQALHEVHFRENLNSCPPKLKKLFKIVAEVNLLKPDMFVGYKKSPDDPPVKLDAMLQYNNELKSDSLDLKDFCTSTERTNTVEKGWISGQKPLVFHRFDAEAEERLVRSRHQHCFICRKHYPVHSRPLINRSSSRRIEQEIKMRQPDEEQYLCQLSSTEHFNFPDFITVEELAYPEFENEGLKKPDVTVGLRSYDLMAFLVDDERRDNCRIRLFDRKLLQRLETEGYLKPPFSLPQRLKKSPGSFGLTFPFLFWEAKTKGGSSKHETVQKQNAKKVKMLVQWQEDIANSAEVPWFPLVWHIVSIGPKWWVHGCHFEEATAGRIYSQTMLWSGDASNEEEALQLLHIVDIVALWGQHMFKPFAGACIQRLEAKLENKEPPLLVETMLTYQLELDRDTFPWLFPEEDDVEPSTPFSAEDRKITIELSHASPESLGSVQMVLEMDKLRLTVSKYLSPQEYVVPQRDCFIWLLDRDLGGNDLLIVRVSEEGVVLPPLVIFDSSDWKKREFRLVLRDEEARRPDNLVVGFRQSRTGSSYMQKCVQDNPGYLREAQIQFCAIIPLDVKSYKHQLDRKRSKTAVLHRLERELGLLKLIEAAHDANIKWCECRAIYNKNSPPFIRCDNLKCPMGWYHKKCVGLPKDFEAKLWLCKGCTERWNTNYKNDFKRPNIKDEEILEASDLRVQRLKSLDRIWKAHPWPEEKKVRGLFNRISCRINISMKEKHNTVDEVEHKTSEEPQCWAILRNEPEVMMPVTPLMNKVA